MCVLQVYAPCWVNSEDVKMKEGYKRKDKKYPPLKKEYCDSIMPVPLRSLIFNIDFMFCPAQQDVDLIDLLLDH